MYHSTLGLRVIKKKEAAPELSLSMVTWRSVHACGDACFSVEGLGLRVWGLGFRVQGLGFGF